MGVTLEINRYQEAIEDFNAASAIPGIQDSTKATILMDRGIAKGRLGRPQEALEDFKAALAVPGINDLTKEQTLHRIEVTKTSLGQR